MNKFPEISLIIVNYNGIDHTRELLASIENSLDKVSYEVVIIDNGSLVNEADILSRDYKNYLIIRSDQNLGFAGGNNLGIKASSGNYIMLINNDTLFMDDSICKLVSTLKSDPSIAVVSPKIYFLSPQNTIQFAGFTELTKITLRNRTIGYNEKDKGQYDLPCETASAHGAAMMFKRELLSQIGYMPEIYFLYYEELDWCTKIRNSGYKIMYQPAATIVHKESQSTGKESPLKIYYMTRNRLLFAYRNRRGMIMIASIFYQLFIADPKLFLKSILRGRIDLAKAVCKGIKNFLIMKKEIS